MNNPFSVLLHSRKFWLMILDLIVSLSTYFITKYVSPENAKDALFVIGALQPVFVLVIASITVQNVEGIRADANTARLVLGDDCDEPDVQ